jgi:malate/lactate dehydrogenase
LRSSRSFEARAPSTRRRRPRRRWSVILLLDQKRVLPWAAYLQGEYDLNDLFVGVPVKLGASSIEEVVELEL